MMADPRVVGAVLRRDFYTFVRASFPIISPNDSFAPNWHIEAVAFALTRVFEGEIKRLIITVPPRSLKSICASVAYPAYVLGHDPARRIICVSYAEGLARKHANDCRALMRSTLYHRLFPNTRISPTKDTELEFATTRGGNRLSTSVGGTLTGRGGNLIIVDDPQKPQDAHSETVRKSTMQWYSNTLLSRLDDKSKDAIIVVMQRLHVDDLVGHLLEQDNWTHLHLPAIAESDHRIPRSDQAIFISVAPATSCTLSASRARYWRSSSVPWGHWTLPPSTSKSRCRRVATSSNGAGFDPMIKRRRGRRATGSSSAGIPP